MTTRCPSCGTASGGRFCHACGTPIDIASKTSAPTPAKSDHWSWFFAGGATALGIAGLVFGLTPASSTPPAAPVAASADVPVSSGAAPDISDLTPRERFDRLYNRVMRAAEGDDQATVTAFAPMAIQAYAMLDHVDVDARYHVALIQLHSGGIAAARAEGDTIQKTEPGHLFGYLVQGAVARYQKDQLALDAIYREFLSHYEAEQRRGRPEYTEHARALEDFAAAARTATARSSS